MKNKVLLYCVELSKFYPELFWKYPVVVPTEILFSQLLCRNNEDENEGKLDAIRLFAPIIWYIQDIISKTVFINSKNQIGFRKSLGCDLNLIRVRQKVKSIQDNKPKSA